MYMFVLGWVELGWGWVGMGRVGGLSWWVGLSWVGCRDVYGWFGLDVEGCVDRNMHSVLLQSLLVTYCSNHCMHILCK